jgi:hypothetical protein
VTSQESHQKKETTLRFKRIQRVPMKSQKTLRTLTLTSLTTAVLATSGQAMAQETIEINMPSPTWDRWMYPFNATPGTRPGGSVFGFWSENLESSTDNRMGQVVFGFDNGAARSRPDRGDAGHLGSGDIDTAE